MAIGRKVVRANSSINQGIDLPVVDKLRKDWIYEPLGNRLPLQTNRKLLAVDDIVRSWIGIYTSSSLNSCSFLNLCSFEMILLHRKLGPNYEVSSMAVIYSLPDCMEQQIHTDFARPSFDFDIDSVDIPFSVIIPIQDGSSLGVIDGDLRKHIPLSIYEAFLIRYDCIHFGSSYDKDNIRLHCYVEPKRQLFYYKDCITGIETYAPNPVPVDGKQLLAFNWRDLNTSYFIRPSL